MTYKSWKLHDTSGPHSEVTGRERERESRLWGSASVGGEGGGLQLLGLIFLGELQTQAWVFKEGREKTSVRSSQL